ncbi:MAG: flavin reductase family protein [Paraburkholderia sp.]|jgi:flavin reductase (DIM6/NTAB) family NADH-FMN oxidoreductase RutF|nr:flavin reductase family protein [Paraburkholderia sp.]
MKRGSLPDAAPPPDALAHACAAVDATTFRQGMRHLVGAVNVLAARLRDGAPVGLTATAVCSLSAEPPALLACVNRASTLGNAIAIGMDFSVNVLGAHHEALARAFGGMAGIDQRGRFALGEWHAGKDGPPLLADALVAFVCRVVQTVEHGSHCVVIGQVEQVALPAIHGAIRSNLVYRNGSFGRFPEPV